MHMFSVEIDRMPLLDSVSHDHRGIACFLCNDILADFRSLPVRLSISRSYLDHDLTASAVINTSSILFQALSRSLSDLCAK